MRKMRMAGFSLIIGGSALLIGSESCLGQTPFRGPPRPSTMNMGSPLSNIEAALSGNAGIQHMRMVRQELDRAIAAQQTQLRPGEERRYRVMADPRELLPRFKGIVESPSRSGPEFTLPPAGGTSPSRTPNPGLASMGTIIVNRDSWRMETPSTNIAAPPPPTQLRLPPQSSTNASPNASSANLGARTQPSAQHPSLGGTPIAPKNSTPKNYSLGVDMRMPSPPPAPKSLKSNK